MSDNEDLLGDDLGDQSLADYNLGNEEEEQLLADDYDGGASQNVPASLPSYGGDPMVAVTPTYPTHEVQYNTKPKQYTCQPDTECVVPNIVVEVVNTAALAPPPRPHPTYAPYEPPHPVYDSEHAVPPAIPAAPLESPQIVPSEAMRPPTSNGEPHGRLRFVSERPAGAQRAPLHRDIPDSLDKVIVPRGVGGRGRGAPWRHAHYHRFNSQYRRNNVHRANFQRRPQMAPPVMHASPPRPEIRMPTHIRPELPPRPDLPPRVDLPPRPELPQRPELHPRPDLPVRPELPPGELGPPPELRPMEMPPELPIMPPVEPYTPMEIRAPFQPNMNVRFPFRPNLDSGRGGFGGIRPMSRSGGYYPRHEYVPRPLPPPHLAPADPMAPHAALPAQPPPPGGSPEIRRLPVALPPALPPAPLAPLAPLAGKKVLINPHFKGTFQPPIEGVLPLTYIPTRIAKSPPPLSPPPPPTTGAGAVKDIEDLAERFIAEQRTALARAAQRNVNRRSPQRYIENTTIEIENDLAVRVPTRSSEEEDLLRRQEEFISANRAGLRRRMRSPSPPRRSPSPPRRSPARRRPDAHDTSDDESEYRRRLREQERMREHVVRAKEARRRRNAAAAVKYSKERSKTPPPGPAPALEEKEKVSPAAVRSPERPPVAPDTTRMSPDRQPARHRSPVKEETQVNSTCEALTPPRLAVRGSPATPPLPVDPALLEERRLLEEDDDDLDLILGDIDGILSDDDDSGRFKDKAAKADPPKPPLAAGAPDLRAKLAPRTSTKESDKKPHRQKIIFHKDDDKRKEKSPPLKRTMVSSSTKAEEAVARKLMKTKAKTDSEPVKTDTAKSRPRIVFDKKEEKEKDKAESRKPAGEVSTRRVMLQRTVTSQARHKAVVTRVSVSAAPALFSRAVRTALGTSTSTSTSRRDEPQVQYDTESDGESEPMAEPSGMVAQVKNLPFGMTDTRLKTLAGSQVQSVCVRGEDRTATITFRSEAAAKTFRQRFNNKMVAASRLTVTLT